MNFFRMMRKRTRRSLFLTAMGMAGGYFFDPQMGPARRRRAKNWLSQLPAVGRRMATQATASATANRDRRAAADLRGSVGSTENTLAAAGR